MNHLNLERMDENGFEEISFKDENISYQYGMGYEIFKRILKAQFPGEEHSIDSYCNMIQKICVSFPMYNAQEGEEILLKESLFHMNAKQYFQ